MIRSLVQKRQPPTIMERKARLKVKHALVLVVSLLMIGMLIRPADISMSNPREESSSLTVETLEKIQNVSDEPDSAGNMLINVNENPSFEYWAGDMPADYDNAFASSYRDADFDYAGPGVTGSYGVLVECEASTTSSALGSVDSSIPLSPVPLVEPGISLTFDWNTLQNPVLDDGGYMYVEVQTWDGGSAYRNFYYYLSRAAISGSNGTYDAGFYLNDTINEWHSFNRNITADYVAVWGAGDLSSSQYVVLVRLRTYSPAATNGVIKAAFDNVVLTNGSYSDWIGNGDFETGDSTSWTYADGSKGYLEQSTDSTHETYSMNISVPEITAGGGSVYLYRSLDYPGGYFASALGMMYVDIDWKYNDSSLGGGSQSAYLELRFINETSYYHIYLYFGTQDNMLHPTNSTNHLYFEIPGFGTKDIWQNSRFDVYDYLDSAGFYNVSLNHVSFRLANFAPGASVFLLVDDFQITTYPLGDPGFEEDWYMDSDTPFAGWDQYNGNLENIRRTTDALQGNYACNLTGTYLNTVGIVRYENIPVHPSDLTNFSWRLDEIGDDSAWAYIRIRYTDNNYINYLLGAGSDHGFSNGSTSCTIYAEFFNTTGSWNLFRRNLTADYEEAFGPSSNLVIDEIVLRISVSTNDGLTILFDEMHFVDGAPPVIDGVSFLPSSPMYYDSVQVDIYAHDDRTGIGEAYVDYHNGTGWNKLPATDMGSSYAAVIPALPYGTTILFEVTAMDVVGLSITDDNGGLWYSYTVGDDVEPTVTMDSPDNMTEWEGFALFQATADDAGSGIDYVEFLLGASLMAIDSEAPYSSPLNLNLLPLGQHTITAVAHDAAGNTANDSVSIIVVDNTPPSIDSPADIEFDEGDMGHFVVWDPSDHRPATYEVYLDDILTFSGVWNSSSEKVNISLDELAVGVRNYTLLVTDDGSNVNTDTVIVTVTDGAVPSIDSPEDIECDEFSTGHSITWSPADLNPMSYTIYRNGSLLRSGPWNSSAETITVSVDGLGLGVYNYTIVVTDVGSNTATNEVWVVVLDGTPPTIDNPSNVEYTEGDTGNEIEWNPYDLHPLSYEILQNGTSLASGVWENGSEPVSLSVDGLDAGTYNFTIVVEDVGGNTASDTVIVTVNAATTTSTSTTTTTATTTTATTTSPPPEEVSPMMILIVGVLGVAAIIVIIAMMRRRGS